ncbi:phage antirepressor KilAC domain-containing protein [Elizabethkingia anophelis]|uniref:phage antirepressor KilAC domain-containing protein n=1 Tax=Elizabethkingia anophelis TaxID=1117645 RepID=UPI0038915A54
MELIKITEQNGQGAVSARELHKFLDITERFSNWFDRMLQYGFIENIDYQGCKVFNTLANQTLIDYALSIDCAKEISMIQRSEKGKQARQYFIECEKKLKTQAPQSFSAALKLAYESQLKIEEQQKQLEYQKPLVIFAEALQISEHSILIGELSKILKQNNIDTGQNRMFEWLRNNGYLMKYGEMRNQPTQKAMDLGLFEVKTRTINNPDGSVRVTKTTKVTPKGQQYFVNKFLSIQRKSA